MLFKYGCRAILILIMAGFTVYCPARQISTGASRHAPASDSSRTDPFLENLLKQYPAYFDNILKNRKALNVQFIYTQVDRGANGIATLKHYYFNVNNARYFYPASAVKLPVSMLALQKLNELELKGLDRNTTMITEKGTDAETAVYNDPTSPDGRPNIAQYIKKMLMVGDNDAYNRLYEFLGQQYINDQLQQKGYAAAQLLHRLGIFLPDEENSITNPVKFIGPGNTALYEQPLQHNTNMYPKRKDWLGNGYYTAGKLVSEPMDFSHKNRISLEDMHTLLVSLVFPNKVTAAQRFNLNVEDRKFLLKYMAQLPVESTYPPYADEKDKYWPAYGKYLLYGSDKNVLPDTSIRIFNRAGYAYGQLIDVAYIVDLTKKIEFFLSAVIYCNNDGILNDNVYEYETIGFPFMKHLGEVLYDYELKRKKKYTPDLSFLQFEYDKK